MNHNDVAALMKGAAPVIHDYVQDAIAPLLERIAVLEARAPVKGEPGKDADTAEILRRIDERFSAAVADIAAKATEQEPSDLVKRVDALESRQPENGNDGADGRDGKDADSEAITASVLEHVMAEFKTIPIPRDGIEGKPGTDGKDADEEAITAKVMDAVMVRLDAIPAPKDGAPGIDGANADCEAITSRVMDAVMAKVAQIPTPKDGEPGKDGEDGVGIAGALIDREGELIVTLTDGQHKKLGAVVGKDGLPGENGLPGRDGFGFEDMFVEYDGERTATIKFTKGEHSKSFMLTLPAIIDRGVWKDGTYERGDAVTWGGSLWIAQEETTDKPETSKAWRLSVKRGRDGKDGVMKVATPPQPVKVA